MTPNPASSSCPPLYRSLVKCEFIFVSLLYLVVSSCLNVETYTRMYPVYLSKDVTGALVLCPALSLALKLPGGFSIAGRKPIVLFTVCINQESS